MKTINAGYTIIDRFTVGEQGFAVGESKTPPSPYVSWRYRKDAPDNFFWGRYFNTKAEAYESYRERIETEAQDLSAIKHEPPLLPPLCLAVHPTTGDLINIRRGERGFYGSDWNRPGETEQNRLTAENMNDRLGVTPAQQAAMRHGSMFGWQMRAADPRQYDEAGNLRRMDKRRDEPVR